MGVRAELSRRQFLARAGAAGAALGLGPPAAWPTGAAAKSSPAGGGFRNSLSVSPFTESVLQHTRLTDAAGTARTVREVQQLFNRHGATEVYARIATRRHVHQGDSRMGFALGLERARLARLLGLPFNPELGLWAEYGDASNYQQPPDFSDYRGIRLPGPWTSLTVEQMERALRQYGELVGRQILGTGVSVNYWDLGNEVEFGVAGVTVRPFSGGPYRPPDRVDRAIGAMSLRQLVGMTESERIAWLAAHLWPHIGRLFAATADGIRSVDRSARFSTHISGIFENTAALPLAFWRSMARAGYEPHQLGTSYYPTAGPVGGQGDRFEWLKHTATALRRRFHKPLMIAETGYPSGPVQGAYPYNTPVAGYPQTPSGQRDFLEALVGWGTASGSLAGVRQWAPDYCVPSGWEPMSLFTPAGRTAHAKPALEAIQHALAGR